MIASRTVRWAHGVVIDWTLHLTRGLPDAVARDRFDQIVSDLWEQEHASEHRRGQGLLLAGSILLRAVTGAPADLAWRRGAVASSPRRAVVARSLPPIGAGGTLFDQTNGAVETADDVPPPDDGAEARDLLAKAVATNAGFGFFGGGGL